MKHELQYKSKRRKVYCFNEPSQHFNVGSKLFQRCGSTLKER